MLMTIHSAKGLEFPVVYVVALEHGILPHERSLNDAEKEEEERRLLFVAVTRAREELHLSHAVYRAFRGQQRMTVPSHFLLELPRDEMEVLAPAWSPGAAFGASRNRPWESDEIHEEEVWTPRSERAGGSENTDDDSLNAATADDDISFPFGAAATDEAGTTATPPDRDATRGERQTAALATLTTAAELASRNASQEAAVNPVSPDVFALGMAVRHPEYGLGKIMALSGNGSRRMATVQFVTMPGQKKFVLVKSPLRPAR
jgi:DNA helicase-2/ATP-dependent DNA helicase PcrA